ncbi:DoxX family protein [Rhodoplanes roseus]|nr:DoxX family protein [Rhodoplanes roseus]
MLKAKDFDLTNPAVVVRLLAGLFYIPHILFKLIGFSGSLVAFGKMGFTPPLLWVSLAILTETICAVGLTLNLYTRYVALMSAGTMALAIYGTVAVKGANWMWNFGGVEYLAFWGIVSVALAVSAWKDVLATTTGYARLTVANAPG